ncbi:FGGY carbohydrate kinase domain-containing protein-like [Ricinus communis]|uniref:FGGY carbohydrate kinase domain-containing protein-like n=1 Tax=Ricinus communis TaxID=3988 RepID=UPI00201AD73F|nr:FGGY carbohydrate kinase domain-containing protein-like [Ricinus communis]
MSTATVTAVPRRSIFLEVDVGTGSARSGLFDENGKLLGTSSSPIHIWKELAVDAYGVPISVSWSGDSRRNIIVWMDHRAIKQAEKINSSNSPILQYCGGALSPEMRPPKLLWVKENLQESWSMVFKWMYLNDWLSYRATGDDTRSLCTIVCKWTYLGHAHMQQMNEKDS